ncbi:MAG: hypothetical protein U9O95_09030 [Candidatus Marinimicrobia bacterium]|nr:hypothetical protein [Candidatus Neomarinimicrobiota bacterium]
MIKRILHIIIFILFLLPRIAAAQDLDSLLAILESHQDDEEWVAILSGEANYHLVYFQAGYESESYFAGRDIGLDQFNMTVQATYSYKQFSATAAGIIYETLYPPLQVTAFSVNYRLPLKFPLDIDINYGRYIFNSDNDTLFNLYPNVLGLGLSHNAGFWGASTDFSLLAGTEGVAPQIMTVAYGNIKLYTWNKKNSISFRPELGFYFGSEVSALAIAPGRWRAKGNGPGPEQGPDPGEDLETSYITRFGLLNTEINFHLLVYLGDLDMTFSVQNNRPRSTDTEIVYAPTSMISLSLGYAFSFIGK